MGSRSITTFSEFFVDNISLLFLIRTYANALVSWEVSTDPTDLSFTNNSSPKKMF